MIGEMGVEHFLAVTQDLGIDILLPNKEEGSMLTGGLTEPSEIAAALAANPAVKFDIPNEIPGSSTSTTRSTRGSSRT